MADFLGVNIPTIQLEGFLSNTWIWVLIVFILGIALVVALFIFLHYRTWNHKIRFFENIAGRGYQQTMFRRAKLINVGKGGIQVLKPKDFVGYLTAYGRKMGRREFWFAKGIDGFWYNIILGDLDGKMNMLDIEPIDRDVSMQHIAMDRITQNNYGEKKSFMDKYGMITFSIIFIVIIIVGLYVMVGRVGDAVAPLKETAATNEKVAELNIQTLEKLNNLLGSIDRKEDSNTGGSVSGLVPANTTGG